MNASEWNGTPYGYLHPHFEGYKVPQWFVDNCVDESWSQDAAPSFVYQNPIRGSFRMFVDAEDPALSEFGGPNYRRFAVYEDAGDEGFGDLLFETNSLDRVIAFLTSENPAATEDDFPEELPGMFPSVGDAVGCFASATALSLPLYWGGYLAARWLGSLL